MGCGNNAVISGYVCLQFRSRGHRSTFWNSKSPSGYHEGGAGTESHLWLRPADSAGWQEGTSWPEEPPEEKPGAVCLSWWWLLAEITLCFFTLESAPTSCWPSAGTKVEETLAPHPCPISGTTRWTISRHRDTLGGHVPRRRRVSLTVLSGFWGKGGHETARHMWES